ncbi:hypothetical protein E4H04_11710 [Candidatus Bathyarchaeota archaeon]|nr:MAG: hypothetical protein E4H04_11710 [Candidatus Bathyarchaeota archaeon]
MDISPVAYPRFAKRTIKKPKIGAFRSALYLSLRARSSPVITMYGSIKNWLTRLIGAPVRHSITEITGAPRVHRNETLAILTKSPMPVTMLEN